MKDEKKPQPGKTEEQHINRRQALGKVGKYAAATSATFFLVCRSKAQAQQSPISAPEDW